MQASISPTLEMRQYTRDGLDQRAARTREAPKNIIPNSHTHSPPFIGLSCVYVHDPHTANALLNARSPGAPFSIAMMARRWLT